MKTFISKRVVIVFEDLCIHAEESQNKGTMTTVQSEAGKPLVKEVNNYLSIESSFTKVGKECKQ